MEKTMERLIEEPVKVRPYWHVDAKWICGLLAVAALGAGLLLTVLTSLTSRTQAVELASTVIASAFSKDGLDAPIDTTDLKKRLAASSTGRVAAIENFPTATVDAADLNLSPRELRLKIFRQIAQPIYDDGLDGAAKKFTDNPVEQEQFKSNAFVLGLVTNETHSQLAMANMIALGVAVVFLLGVVLFSDKWGRLANPGVILVWVGFPGVVAGLALAKMTEGGEAIGVIPPSVLVAAGNLFSQLYPMVVMAGAALIVVAGLGKMVTAMVHAARARKTGTKAVR